MIVKEVSQLGNPVIRQKAKTISDASSKEVRKVITDLTDSMRHYDLVGMAAPQIGKSMRLFVTEIRKTTTRDPKTNDELRVFINPRIVSASKKTVIIREGCGSVAESKLFGSVRRPAAVVVRAKDAEGKPFELSASGLLARVIQHEMDHLNGIVFSDRCSPKTFISISEHRKLQAQGK